MDRIIVTVSGILLIAAIYRFFFGKRETATEAGNALTVIVDGGYKPGIIRISKDKPARLTFLRRDPNPCLDEVVLPDYKIREYLPVGKPVTVILNPPHPVDAKIRCGMNMFHGKIITDE
ncbi:hypothetical protein A2Z33_03475 [Candidatus Gottesmanbacteria bacterium RBG_16_52_11]|uniref:EfeO-type cupredoxin-like domain-containing protein n=1 Tax=Candidatus Gottesmanbacteria bacterium RBG_16_52_11 TaxID=1798374 RepID=A0A1F5YVJ0_9BACT|nr:MAG: hypothetical protein A2Z33_03475 [Candidatus Gottesmanbacteria bacterium RBG_16_52_11]